MDRVVGQPWTPPWSIMKSAFWTHCNCTPLSQICLLLIDPKLSLLNLASLNMTLSKNSQTILTIFLFTKLFKSVLSTSLNLRPVILSVNKMMWSGFGWNTEENSSWHSFFPRSREPLLLQLAYQFTLGVLWHNFLINSWYETDNRLLKNLVQADTKLSSRL